MTVMTTGQAAIPAEAPATDGRKQETRERVLRAAAGALREHGPDGVGIAAIMRQAGLTHGGFYAHFRNKDDLVAQAVSHAFLHMARRFPRLTAPETGPAALGRYVDAYLSPAHRDARATSCPLTALSADIARQAPPVRQAFEAGLVAVTARVTELMPKPDERRARVALSMMAGAVVLARACAGSGLSDTILEDARSAARALLGLPPAPSEASHV